MSTSVRRTLAIVAGLALFVAGAATTAALRQPAVGGELAPVQLPAFGRAVFLSHVNDPARTPLFPGDPAFHIRTVFTVPNDGYYLEVVREGTHTGTHYSAPCHFHQGALCMDDLSPSDLILPAVVVDVRDAVAADPDHVVGVPELKAWEDTYGQMPSGAAVLLLTGCSDFWAGHGDANYLNCGSGRSGVHQPGFSRSAVRWLIRTGVLGRNGATGTDTFGPDPSSDAAFLPTWLTLRKHRLTLENLTNLEALPPVGAWVVLGSPRNVHGSGAPGTVFGLVP
jgi:kynurenine formamidase